MLCDYYCCCCQLSNYSCVIAVVAAAQQLFVREVRLSTPSLLHDPATLPSSIATRWHGMQVSGHLDDILGLKGPGLICELVNWQRLVSADLTIIKLHVQTCRETEMSPPVTLPAAGSPPQRGTASRPRKQPLPPSLPLMPPQRRLAPLALWAPR